MASPTILIRFLGSTDHLKRALSDVQERVTGMTARVRDRLEATGAAMRDLGSKMTIGVTLPIGAAAFKAVQFAGALEDAQAMSQQVFGSMSQDIESWSRNATKALGLSRGQAIEWANQIGIRLRSVGDMTEVEAAKQSKALVQLAADFASAFGGSVEEAAQAISSGLTGEFEPLKRYGVVLNDTMLKNELLALTGQKVTGTLTAQQKVTATLSALTKQTSIVQGDYARNASGATNTFRTFTASLRDLGEQLGTIILPYAKQLVEWGQRLADKFEALTPTQKKFAVILGVVAAAAGPVIFILGAIATGLAALISPVGAVVAVIAAVAAGLAVAYAKSETFREVVHRIAEVVMGALRAAWEWLQETAIPAVKQGFEALLPVLQSVGEWLAENLGPVLQSIGELIAAVAQRVGQGIGIIVGFIREHGDKIVAIFRYAWGFIQPLVEGVLRAVRGIITFVTGVISGDWSKAWQGVKDVFGGIWNAIWGTLKNIVGLIIDLVKGIPRTIFNIFKGAGSWLIDVGGDILGGLLNGMKNMLGKVKDWLGDVGKKIISWKGPIEVDRKLLIPTGRVIMEGLQVGLADGWEGARNMLAGITSTIPAVAASGGGGVAGAAVHVHFHGPVTADGERWVVDTIARARAKGMIG